MLLTGLLKPGSDSQLQAVRVFCHVIRAQIQSDDTLHERSVNVGRGLAANPKYCIIRVCLSGPVSVRKGGHCLAAAT